MYSWRELLLSCSHSCAWAGEVVGAVVSVYLVNEDFEKDFGGLKGKETTKA